MLARIRHSPALLLALCVLVLAPAARAEEPALRAQRLLGPSSPFARELQEQWRRGAFDRTRGMLPPRDRAEAAELLADSQGPAASRALGWLEANPSADDAPLGFRIDSDLALLAFAADPHRQLEPVFTDLRSGESVDPAWRGRLGFWADARLARGLGAHLRFVFDTEGRNDPHNRTRDFNQLGASNNLDEAYLRYRIGPAAFTVGRRFLDWGPSPRGSLILSSLAPAPDQIHAELDFGKHRLQAFVGRLSSEQAFLPTLLYDPATDAYEELEIETTLTRHLYGHRLEFSLWTWGRVGLSETALVSRAAGGLDLGYLNPVGIHVVNETEKSGGDGDEVNVLHQVDGEFWLGAWHLYGAFLVDDWQIDKAPRETWPDQLAGSIGLDRALGPRALLGYEYRHIGSWTYLHRGYGTDVRNFERPLAAPEGPDMDRHLLEFSWRPAESVELWAQAERRRRGINRITTEEDREGHAGEDFPRAPVERRWVGTLGGSLRPASWMQAEALLAYHSVQGVNGTERDEDILEFRCLVRLFSPPLRWLLGDG